MLSTARELVEAGLERIPNILVGHTQGEDLRAVPDLVRRACTTCVFECRLDENEQVDLTLGLTRRSFAGLGRPWNERLTSLEPVAAFLDGWLAHDTLLGDHVERAWLAFDRHRKEGCDEPFLYFAPETDCSSDEDLLRLVVSQGLKALDPGCSSGTQAAIGRCLKALPDGGTLLLVAPAAHRRRDSARLTVCVDPRDLPSYLERIGWPGDRVFVTSLLSALGGEDWRIPTQIDVCGEIGPRVSFEFYDQMRPLMDPRWKRVLDCVEGWGACSPTKRASLLRWHNRDGDEFHREFDLKVSLDARGTTQAKAYLAVQRSRCLFV